MMLRKSCWALALSFSMAALMAGCGGTETTVEPPVPVPDTGKGPDPAANLPGEKKGEEKAAEPAKEAPKAAEPAKEAPKAEEKKEEAPKVEAPKVEAPKAEPAKEAPKGASTVKLNDEQLAEVKKLPAAEQAVALKQGICPVSDEPLGAMGVPIKVVAEGKTVYVCCKGCTKDVEKDPKAALAKLGLN